MTTVLKMAAFASALTLREIDTAGLHCGFYTIYPELAAQLLEQRNPKNRKIKEAKISQLVFDIKNGKFQLNGESIIFSNKGMLLNGQHRLTAIIAANMAVTTVVVLGIAEGNVGTIDQGIARGVGDVLHMETDTPNGNVLGAIARAYCGYLTNDGTYLGRHGHISRAAILQTVVENPQLFEIARWANNLSAHIKGIASSSQMGVARAILEPVYGDEAVHYLERVAHGDGIAMDSPAFVVRKRMLAAGRTTTAIAVECMMRGAIAWMAGRSMSRMQLDGKLPLLKKR